MGLVANSGEQMHALLYVSLFLFLGKLPLIVIEWLTFLHSMLREFYCIWQLIFFCVIGSSSIQPFVQFSTSLASEVYSSFAANAKEDDGPIIDGTAVPADGHRP